MKFKATFVTGTLLLLTLNFSACKEKMEVKEESISLKDYSNDKRSSAAEYTPVTVTSKGMNFELPKKIKSGWQEFRYENKSGDTHFFILEKLPEGKHIEDSKKEVVPVFDAAMQLINQGEAEKGFEKFGELPEWFSQIQFLGGAGLVSPGHTAYTTLNLEPGNYLLECYVKMPNGSFHSTMGMLEEIEVISAKSNHSEPEAENVVNISTANGIVLENKIKPGLQTFKVNFLDQKTYSNFVGHDVNLLRYDSDKDLVTLNKWVNWLEVGSLTSPAPENLVFLGGTQELPGGSTAYFTADLKPGKYALVSEIPDPKSHNMLLTFEINEEEL
ncbi:hypothetical protein [Christiangramia aquimixticola]|uniref:hypothetical protein n=1 Tax=Christiangramia aquimixticola TaxID=1697558 RepID=UPI003AA7D13C